MTESKRYHPDYRNSYSQVLEAVHGRVSCWWGGSGYGVDWMLCLPIGRDKLLRMVRTPLTRIAELLNGVFSYLSPKCLWVNVSTRGAGIFGQCRNSLQTRAAHCQEPVRVHLLFIDHTMLDVLTVVNGAWVESYRTNWNTPRAPGRGCINSQNRFYHAVIKGLHSEPLNPLLTSPYFLFGEPPYAWPPGIRQHQNQQRKSPRRTTLFVAGEQGNGDLGQM